MVHTLKKFALLSILAVASCSAMDQIAGELPREALRKAAAPAVSLTQAIISTSEAINGLNGQLPSVVANAKYLADSIFKLASDKTYETLDYLSESFYYATRPEVLKSLDSISASADKLAPALNKLAETGVVKSINQILRTTLFGSVGVIASTVGVGLIAYTAHADHKATVTDKTYRRLWSPYITGAALVAGGLGLIGFATR